MCVRGQPTLPPRVNEYTAPSIKDCCVHMIFVGMPSLPAKTYDNSRLIWSYAFRISATPPAIVAPEAKASSNLAARAHAASKADFPLVDV